MCLNCGCGELNNLHGNPLNITANRLKLVADRNDSSLERQAVNILATLRGVIKKGEPRGDDEILVKLTRVKAKPKLEVQYVPKQYLTKKKPPKKSAE